MSGGYDNVIDTNGAGANTVSGGGHQRITDDGATNQADHGTISGGSSNTIKGGAGALTNHYSTVGGGTLNTITGANAATIAGGDQNVVTGASGTVAGGKSNTVSGTYGVAGGLDNVASGASGAVALGRANVASGTSSTTLGYGNQATATATVATGQDAKAVTAGAWAHAGGKINTVGDAQSLTIVLRRETTDATTTAMTPNVTVQDGAACAYRATIVAHDVATGDSKAWKIDGLLRRAGTVVTQVGGAPTPVVLAADAGASAWTAVAFTGTSTFTFRVTGAAGTTIRWSARFDAAEVL